MGAISTTRIVIAIVVIFILESLIGGLIHRVLLNSDYAAVANLYRGPADTKYVLIFVGNLAFAIGAVWLYSHGVEDRPWVGQGVRFGIALWLVLMVPWFLVNYAVQPIPESLVWKQLGCELINKVILGIVTAGIVRRG